MREFDVIARYFSPLAGKEGLSLQDDAALIDLTPDQQLVVTTDALSAGVHFLGDEDAALIAQKALRVNLSDLAAKGATPLVYFLSLMLPKATNEDWIKRFAEGLERDQAEFGIRLAGGDTIATHGPLSLSITAFGTIPRGQALLRSGVQIGDAIYVSGTLGDAVLGLASLQRKASSNPSLEQRYLLPQPRITLGHALRNMASSCIDISDGLVQDLGHICAASHVGAVIHAPLIPLSPKGILEAALTGGDDYELLFTVPQEKTAALPAGVTRIGEIVEGNKVHVLDEKGTDITPARGGFQHF